MHSSPTSRDDVLEQLELARRSGALDPKGVARVAQDLHLPIAAARGMLSWYVDLHADVSAIRVCHGTSCALAGAQELSRSLSEHHRCRDVFCVGYCDRSPAMLMPDDRVVIHGRPEAGRAIDARGEVRLESEPPPSLPDVRHASRAAAATGRLAGDGCGELTAARAAGVYHSLNTSLHAPAELILAAVEQSGLRGRGGAGFPTGRKWRAVAQAPGNRKYVIANGDEGDPGSFIDRALMEHDPHSILEGMILAAHAVGASEGIVFIRSEYPAAIAAMQRAIEEARTAGYLSASIRGTARAFDVRVAKGLGSYVCGEETAMLNAIEGRRGEARPRPPYPAEEGLDGKPTLIDNVETLVNVPWIMQAGAAAYRAMGTAATPGTIALCLNHGFARPGIVEVEFGTSLRRVIEELAGGAAPNTELEAVLIGGPMGSIVPIAKWDVPVCMGAMAERGIRLGHGGIVALPRGTDYRMLVRHMLAFMAHESCGKCVPCRIGTKRAMEVVSKSGLTTETAGTLGGIFHLMEQASLCGFGRETPGPVRELLEQFGPQILEA